MSGSARNPGVRVRVFHAAVDAHMSTQEIFSPSIEDVYGASGFLGTRASGRGTAWTDSRW